MPTAGTAEAEVAMAGTEAEVGMAATKAAAAAITWFPRSRGAMREAGLHIGMQGIDPDGPSS